jgi:hypothetical protein
VILHHRRRAGATLTSSEAGDIKERHAFTDTFYR